MEWPSMLFVTCLGAAIAFGSFNFGRRVVTLNNSDDEDKDGDTNNAVAVEGHTYNVNLGFGVHRFGVGLNLLCAHTRLGGNYDNVIITTTPLALMVSGAESASSSGR
ncbi:hypothetical protein RHSIM_Rhsim11G0176100 [Rhododendron simsii]|uniref:Uncharacterized protein n=1 Tax=Rhododendron simsii TaxID=118357 RepID=A0A834G8J5_RHOSS|nr:hypothetical protein RHSIM_Rhsim11G0176100 [Rhododendron simsii]